MPFATVNGHRLYYEVGGDGEIIVFIHGFLTNADIMEAPASGLGSGFRAIRIDRLGHGRSTPVEAPVSLAEEARDIAALLDWFGAESAHFVTHDTGAEVALEFALTYPGRTGSIALLAPELDGNPVPADVVAFRQDIIAAYRVDPKKALEEKYFPQHCFDVAREDEIFLERVEDFFLKAGVASYYKFDPAPRPVPRHIQRLGEIRSRLAVLIGDREDSDRIRAAVAIAKGVRGAQLFTFPGTSRFLHIEDSRAVMRKLSDFFLPEDEN